MKSFLVSWSVDIEATTPTEAARAVAAAYFQPRIAAGEPETACVFDVRPSGAMTVSPSESVDLSEVGATLTRAAVLANLKAAIELAAVHGDDGVNLLDLLYESGSLHGEDTVNNFVDGLRAFELTREQDTQPNAADPRVTVLARELEIVYGYGLEGSDDIRADYDYMDDTEFLNAPFIQHDGITYAIGDFLKVDDVAGYHAAYGENAFSALYIALSADGETVTLARVTA